MADDRPLRSDRYPELEYFPSREEARCVVHDWKKRLIRMPRFWLSLVLYTVAVGGTTFALLLSVRRWVHIPASMYGGIVGGITGGSGFVVVNWIWRHKLRRYLREQLMARGIPVCLKCGYDLRGQSVPRCPECGTPYDAELIAASRRATDNKSG